MIHSKKMNFEFLSIYHSKNTNLFNILTIMILILRQLKNIYNIVSKLFSSIFINEYFNRGAEKEKIAKKWL